MKRAEGSRDWMILAQDEPGTEAESVGMIMSLPPSFPGMEVYFSNEMLDNQSSKFESPGTAKQE